MNPQTESPTHIFGRWLLNAQLAWLLITLTWILSTLSFVFLALNWATPVPDTWGFRGDAMLLALAYGGIGLLLARRHPQNPIGWLLLLAGLINSILEFCVEYATYAMLTKPGELSYGTLAAWIASWLWVIGIAILIYVFLLFPTGHLPSARWRPVAWFFVGAFGLLTFAFMIRPGSLYFAPYLDNPFAVQVAYRVLSPIPVATAAAVLLVGISVILRLRRAEGVERQQLKWFAYAATLRAIFGMSESVVEAVGLRGMVPKLFEYLSVALWIAIAVAIAFAILRYRLWDIDIIINRTLVYGSLTALIVAIYLVIVGGLGMMFQTQTNALSGLVAAGIIALLLQPLRVRLQRGVNRLLYGERDDPAIVLTRLAQQMETTDTPADILPNLVQTIAHMLKIPHVAILLPNGENQFEPAAVWGESPGHTEMIPLTYQKETMGHLVVAPRGPYESFNRSEQQLLNTIAALTANTVRAVQLSDELRQSRRHIVTAREDERRRLRRDLHDGLGPQLASQTLGLEAVSQLMPSNPEKAQALLNSLKTQAQEAMLDVRRLVYDLRPPALDDLGLIGALQQSVSRYATGALRFDFDVPPTWPELPAAVETAAYRIAQEAMTNVVRHAGATVCTVRLTCADAQLIVEVRDNGRGLSQDRTCGVGLQAMKERATELNGQFLLESLPDGGTLVHAWLPLEIQDE